MTFKKNICVFKSIKEFEKCCNLGSGGSAKVYKYKCLNEGFNEGKYFAIKKIKKYDGGGNSHAKRINNEIKIHSQVLHPSIVKYHGSFEDNEYSYIVLELCEKGSLHDLLKRKGALSEEEACYLIEQVIDGVIGLHSMQIIHRDLTLKNILLTSQDEVKIKYKVKIADLGLAKFIHDCQEERKVVGTSNFMAPEAFRGSYDFKTDCWSVGCVLYALLYGALPFHAEKYVDRKARILTSDLYFPEYASAEAIELLTKLLKKSRRDRIELKEALKLPFFKKYTQVKKTYKSYRRNEDSGMNSLSKSSSSSSRRSREIYASYDRGPLETSMYNKNRPTVHPNLKSVPSDLSKSTNVRDQIKSKMNILPTKLTNPDRGYRTLRKEEEISSQKHSSEHYDHRPLTSTTIQENGEKWPSRNLRYYSPELSTIHNLNCSNYDSSSSTRKRDYFKNNENKSIQKNAPYMKEDRIPLDTTRLESRTKRITSTKIASILDDGQVCLQLLKLEENKEYVFRVYLISSDGLQIKVFNPGEKILLSDFPMKEILASDRLYKNYRYFTFENLSEFHWKRYQIAKAFIDEVKAITKKVVVRGKSAKCTMMENTPNPDYEIQFCNGYQITDKGSKITIKDKNGKEVFENNRNTEKMLEEFEKMKEKCKAVEMFNVVSMDSEFPVHYSLGHQQSNKENITPRNSSLSISSGLSTVDGIAFDWIYGHIYWTDAGKNKIQLSDKTGKMRKTIVSNDLDEPRAIVLNPLDGWVYWTDWGEPAKIERAGMDGSHRAVVISTDVKWPNGLALDLVTKKICWADAKLHTLNCADYNGDNRRVILSSPLIIKHPFSIDIFEDWIYWSDWESEAIHRMNKFTGEERSDILNDIFSPMDIHVYHHYKQPNGTNYCSNMNGHCSHLCLPTPFITERSPRYTCACPDGMELTTNGVTCVVKTVLNTTSTTVSTTSSQGTHIHVVTPAATDSSYSVNFTNSSGSYSGNVQPTEGYSIGNNSVLTANGSIGELQHSTLYFTDSGKLAGIIIGALFAFMFLLGLVGFLIYKHYLRKNVTSMNFDNPVYRKTTEDQFSLEKNQYQPARSYPPSLEPLTSPGTNEFV